MQQESTDELGDIKLHDLDCRSITIVAPAGPDLSVIQAQDALIRDCDPVGVAAEIGDNLAWSGKRSLGVNDPVGAFEIGDEGSEDLVIGQSLG